MNTTKVEELPAEGRLHLHFMASRCRRQVAKEKYDVHEHPATALSWKEDVVEALARHPLSQVVAADRCRYGLVTPAVEDQEDVTGDDPYKVLDEVHCNGRSNQQTMQAKPCTATAGKWAVQRCIV